MGQVPCPATILLRGPAGAAEVFDQLFTFLQFLLFEAEHGTDLIEPQRQPVVRGPDQRAFPRGRIEVVLDGIIGDAVGPKVLRIIPAQPDRQADALESGIVSKLRHPVIGEGGDDLIRDSISAGEIIHSDWAVIDGDAEEQYFEVRRFRVLIHTALGDVDT